MPTPVIIEVCDFDDVIAKKKQETATFKPLAQIYRDQGWSLDDESHKILAIGAARQGLGGSGSPLKKGALLRHYQNACKDEDGNEVFSLDRHLLLDDILGLPSGTTFDEILNIEDALRNAISEKTGKAKEDVNDENIDEIDIAEVFNEGQTPAYDALARQLQHYFQQIQRDLPSQEQPPTAYLSQYQSHFTGAQEEVSNDSQKVSLEDLQNALKTMLDYNPNDFRNELIKSEKSFYDKLDKTIFNDDVYYLLPKDSQAQQAWLQAKTTLKPIAEDKSLLVYRHAHHVAGQYPDSDISCQMRDNKQENVLQKIHECYGDSQAILPSNVTLQTVHTVNQGDRTDSKEYKEFINGCGNKDPQYSQTVSDPKVLAHPHKPQQAQETALSECIEQAVREPTNQSQLSPH